MIDKKNIFWTGVVEDTNDPQKIGRCRVRIIGHHSPNKTEIPTNSLPWAIPIQPIISSGVSGIGFSPTGIVEGSWCVGFFQDGDDAQIPVILGTISGVPEEITNVFDQKKNDGNSNGEGDSDEEKNKNLENYNIDFIVVHCTATKSDQNIGASQIDSWHRQNGFEEIGYHYVIRRNGAIESGREPTKVGRHTKGFNNKTIAVALVGGVDDSLNPENNFTRAQFDSLRNFISDTVKTFPSIKVLGHNQIRNKSCPSFDVAAWLENVMDEQKASADDISNYNPNSKAPGKRLQEPVNDVTEGAERTEGYAEDVLSGNAEETRINNQNFTGFKDPNGIYPIYTDESDVNRLARGENLEETILHKKNANRTLNVPKTDGSTWNEPASPYDAKYPDNSVYESKSGHVQEIDDTPNAERMHTYHRAGSFEEYHPNGSKVEKIVGNGFEIFLNDKNVSISGDCNVFIQNNADLVVNGDAMVDVSGSCETNVEGDYTQYVGGDYNLAVKGGYNMAIDGESKVSGTGNIGMKTSGNITLQASKIDLNT